MDELLSDEEIKQAIDDVIVGDELSLFKVVAQAQLDHLAPIREAELSKKQQVISELTDKVLELRVSIGVLAMERSNETWYWQGDGEDHLDSLTCPIIITPEKFKAEIKAAKEQAIKRTYYWLYEICNNPDHHSHYINTVFRCDCPETSYEDLSLALEG